MTGRRNFLTKANGVVATIAAAAIIDAPNVIAQPKVQWRLSTAWPVIRQNLVRIAREHLRNPWISTGPVTAPVAPRAAVSDGRLTIGKR